MIIDVNNDIFSDVTFIKAILNEITYSFTAHTSATYSYHNNRCHSICSLTYGTSLLYV